MVDVARRTNPDKKIARIAELLSQKNEMVADLVSMEANGTTGHRSTIRTGLSTGTWRKMYQGVPPSKTETSQVTDTIGNLERFAVVDVDVAELNGNSAAFLMSENIGHIEAMAQDIAETTIYGDETVNEERFTGLAPRYNDLSAENARNIIDGGGTGSDNTSIWLCVHDENAFFSIYPKGKKGGLQFMNDGIETVYDANSNPFKAYQMHYKHEIGIVLKDWRQVGRICNIDVSDLDTLANTENLVTWMTQLTERIENLKAGRASWYVNRTVREKLRLGILEKISSQLVWETVAGQMVMLFDGIPVKIVDQILNTESQVT
jgi:hypothetical protein